jgi:hypothetical protein
MSLLCVLRNRPLAQRGMSKVVFLFVMGCFLSRYYASRTVPGPLGGLGRLGCGDNIAKWTGGACRKSLILVSVIPTIPPVIRLVTIWFVFLHLVRTADRAPVLVAGEGVAPAAGVTGCSVGISHKRNPAT